MTWCNIFLFNYHIKRCLPYCVKSLAPREPPRPAAVSPYDRVPRISDRAVHVPQSVICAFDKVVRCSLLPSLYGFILVGEMIRRAKGSALRATPLGAFRFL